MRSAGLIVVDQPHPQAAGDLSVNHGGGVVFSVADLAWKPVPVDRPSTVELICVHAVAGQFAAIIAIVYRPGSPPVQQSYFDELGAVLEQLATYTAPVYITDDLQHSPRPS